MNGPSTPPSGRRPAWSDKTAAVALLTRAAGPDGRPLPQHVRDVAARHGVTTRAVYGWLNDPRLRDKTEKAQREQFVITLDHLAVLANEQNAVDAHEVLEKAGLVTCSYATFTRALRKADPAIVQGSLSGHPGFVRNRVYQRFVAPHRGHTWHFDHTTADAWVWQSHKHTSAPIRPYVSVVVDSSTGYWLAAVASPDPVSAEHVAAFFAQASDLREEHGTVVGGLPAVMTFDNAAEHHARAIMQGAARLGVIPDSTAAYHPWQNGKGERPMGLVNQKLCAKLPGATARQAGTDETGAPRFVAALPKDVRGDEAVGWGTFETMLEALRTKVNTKYRMTRLGGLTRAQAWAADPTELVVADEEVVAQAMLVTAGDNKVGGDGIHFRNKTYIAPGMARPSNGRNDRAGTRGTWVKVRHFPTNTDYIEVFDLEGEHLYRAWDTLRLTPSQDAAFKAARRKQEADHKAVQAGVTAHRKQLAAVWHAAEAEGTEPHDESAAFDQAARADAEGGDTAVAAATRPRLPRAPAPPAQGEQEHRAARKAAVSRLDEINARRAAARGAAGTTDPEETP